jgi:glycosyltransferase involved in cell wall biosynthesis
LNILQTDFHRLWSGQTARVFHLSRELARRGHRVTIATPPGSVLGQRARQAGLKVFERVLFSKPIHSVHLLRDIVALGRLLRTEAFDVVHVHGSQDTWAVALTLRVYGMKQPILMTRHNSKPVRFHALNRWLYRSAVRRVVAVSSGTSETYRRFFDANVLREDEVRVIHSCIDVDRFSGALFPDRVRAELGVGADDPLIGLIGRIDRDKGHLVLLDAAPEVLSAFPRAVFVFVGRGGRMERIVRDAIRHRRLEQSVRLLGFREDIQDITAALDLSVLPALGTDSSPAVLKEALFLGKPVVASRIGGIPEIVTEEMGILVSPGDSKALAQAIIAALKGLRQAPGRTGPGFPHRFTPDYLCAAYLQVYQEMLGSHGDLRRDP